MQQIFHQFAVAVFSKERTNERKEGRKGGRKKEIPVAEAGLKE
jgi:hypothetical protein